MNTAPGALQFRDVEKRVPNDNALVVGEGDGALFTDGLLSGATPYDVEAVRADFPILHRPVRGRPLVYLDTAASAQKPAQVIEAERSFYAEDYANIHRGLYFLSQRATQRYDEARRKVKSFLNARHEHEIIFTRSATEAINLVAASFGEAFLKEGDEVLITGLEHHSNIVPWQMLREKKGIVLKVAPLNDTGEVPLEDFTKLLGPRTRLAAFAQVSNALGTVLPVAQLTRAAHAAGAKVLIDGAQSIVHMGTDVQALDCDFFVFSGHKLYGPTGIGVLYGKEALLDAMPPYQGGGDMIANVTFEKTTFAPLPTKFEAGTPAIAQAVALGAAIDYLTELGIERIVAHEASLLDYASRRLSAIKSLAILGTAAEKASVISFIMHGVHPHDIAQVLDSRGVAVRAGHHCAQPVMARFGVPATVRASFGLYNTTAEVDALAEALERVERLFVR
ncbi:MAG TPA: cysteine desulfurase [Candidatus Dormibacteraeota bacterium]|nr:cysteine desulfurase [Candidatus Dormibacteraeota bacterium]